MAEAGLRKRKANTLSKAKGRENKTHATSSKTPDVSTLIYVSVCCLAAILLYLYPHVIKQALQQWTGFSEGEPPLPGTSEDINVDFSADIAKRDAVVEAFTHAWLAYERDAMGDDEYHPISRKGSNLTTAGGIGYTVVDSIDAMLIMGLDVEYQRARNWVANKMTFDRDANFNTFETTIRVLGGLLSAYHLSGEDSMYLKKAVDLGDRILSAFETPSGLPLSMVNLGLRQGVADPDYPGLVSTAEAATLQLEFRYLSVLTDEDVYWRKAERVMAVIKGARIPPGLATIFMNYQEGRFVPSAIRLGSRGDSYYEYLLKQFLQTNRTEPVYREMYDDTMNAVHSHLVQTSTTARMKYTAELIPERGPSQELSWRLTPKQDHLVCFIGGSMMLGAVATGSLVDNVPTPPKKEHLSPHGTRDWKTGVDLIETCMQTHKTATGLAPEIVHFRIPSDGVDAMLMGMAPQDWYIKGGRQGQPASYDARYMLRPETVESLFVAFRLTGDRRYRDYGWQIFEAIQRHCRVETGGYASVMNVDQVPVELEDKMETFLMSETLKYLYLLFADASVLPLSEYVFNTEAHPLPVFNPSIRTGFS